MQILVGGLNIKALQYPDRSGPGRVPGAGADKAFRVASIGLVEHLLALFDDLSGHAVMQHIPSQQGNPAVISAIGARGAAGHGRTGPKAAVTKTSPE